MVALIDKYRGEVNIKNDSIAEADMRLRDALK
jgi:hypothetical protein